MDPSDNKRSTRSKGADKLVKVAALLYSEATDDGPAFAHSSTRFRWRARSCRCWCWTGKTLVRFAAQNRCSLGSPQFTADDLAAKKLKAEKKKQDDKNATGRGSGASDRAKKAASTFANADDFADFLDGEVSLQDYTTLSGATNLPLVP